jgi:hypothetical protein
MSWASLLEFAFGSCLSRPVKLSSALFELTEKLIVYHNVPPAGFGNILADSVKPWIVSTCPEMGQETRDAAGFFSFKSVDLNQ